MRELTQIELEKIDKIAKGRSDIVYDKVCSALSKIVLEIAPLYPIQENELLTILSQTLIRISNVAIIQKDENTCQILEDLGYIVYR